MSDATADAAGSRRSSRPSSPSARRAATRPSGILAAAAAEHAPGAGARRSPGARARRASCGSTGARVAPHRGGRAARPRRRAPPPAHRAALPRPPRRSASATMESQACEFEHILSPEATDSVCTLLGHPPTCPHGKPIPPGPCCGTFQKTLRPLVTGLRQLRARRARAASSSSRPSSTTAWTGSPRSGSSRAPRSGSTSARRRTSSRSARPPSPSIPRSRARST